MKEKCFGIKKAKLFGLPVAVCSPEKAVERIVSAGEERGGKYVTFCNVHTLITARRDPEYKEVQRSACLVMPDGKPLSWLLRKRGIPAEQIAGPDFMERMLSLPEEMNGSHYFYGSTVETLKDLGNSLEERYPHARIVGMESPSFGEMTEKEEREAVERMNASGADYIWVALGAPKQERFMYRNAKYAKGMMLGVGAAFDFHSGHVRRAPKKMRNMGLEWLYRLMQDPRRLWKRYLVTNTRFLLLVPGYLFRSRHSGRKKK